MTVRDIHCDWCGEFISRGHRSNEPESCGKTECEREIRRMHEAEREQARWEAERDDFARYR